MKTKSLLLFIPMILSLAGCTSQLTLKSDEQRLASRTVTEANDVVVFPDDNPSTADGKVVWDKMNCAQCHGGGAAQTTSSETPQGGPEPTAKAATTAGGATRAPGERQVDTQFFSANLSDKATNWKIKPLDQYLFLTYGAPGVNHPLLKDKLSRREIWDLVFYSRTLSLPFIADNRWMEVDPVFGANCAVCHGKRGHGDGPLARNMEPVPANFHQFNRFYDRTDEQIWEHIAYGIKWEGMPNFLGKTDRAKNVKFDKAYITELVQYIRSFTASNKPTVLPASMTTTTAPASTGSPDTAGDAGKMPQ